MPHGHTHAGDANHLNTAHAVNHTGAAATTPHSAPAGQDDSPAPCPHCAGDNTHATPAADCFGTAAAPSAAKPAPPNLKAAFHPVDFPPVRLLRPARASPPDPRPARPLEPIALNLRHCVLLI